MITPGTLLRRTGKTTPVYRALSIPNRTGSVKAEPVTSDGVATGPARHVSTKSLVAIRQEQPEPRAHASDVLHYMRHEAPAYGTSSFGVSVRFKCTLREADVVLATLAGIGEIERAGDRYRLPPVKG